MIYVAGVENVLAGSATSDMPTASLRSMQVDGIRAKLMARQRLMDQFMEIVCRPSACLPCWRITRQ